MIKDLKGGNDMKITMKTPLVEMDGDEMTRVIWAKIKEILLEPHIDLKTEYYDLGLKKRDETDDRITVEAAEATKIYGVSELRFAVTSDLMYSLAQTSLSFVRSERVSAA